MTRRYPSLLVSLVLIWSLCACADLLKDGGGDGADKRASVYGLSLGELSFEALSPLEGTFKGPPLWVSNNPEDIEGYGLLSSTRAEGRGSRALADGAPSPTLRWEEAGRAVSAAQGCSEGAFKQLKLYIAHILSSKHLSGGRRLSVLIEADEPLTLVYQGVLGTTSWSDLFGYKTTRPDWLGAQVALDTLNRASELDLLSSPIRGQVTLGAGERHALKTVRADSLIEGAFSLEGDGCFALHVLAHDQALDVGAALPDYALGDVKWPGWYQGGGYGRAAGLYEGSAWLGEVQAELTTSRDAFGWRLFDAQHSPLALGRHEDSAALLFGGYGVVYETRVNLSNTSAQCLSAHLGFTSYVKLAMRPGVPDLGDQRTPSVTDLDRSDPTRRPTMLWNGPVQLTQQLGGGSVVDQRLDVI